MSKFTDAITELKNEISEIKNGLAALDPSPLVAQRTEAKTKKLRERIAELEAQIDAATNQEPDTKNTDEKPKPEPRKTRFKFFKDEED